ncbi:Heme oxygenase (staphylobilin-producing) [Deinococcus xinjiangensis]|uniref:Heme oxygenase (Staphylobilin-producing) n=1 Tax=Deinococcus xinjiangensis TaxID=457454 RepID=A0ABP9VEI5_9DEIO
MIAVANRIFVHPDYHEAFTARFRARPRQVDTRLGFLHSHILRPTVAGEPFVVLSFWESREAFEAWRTSPNFKEGHKGASTLPPEAFSAPNVLEIHEVVGD